MATPEQIPTDLTVDVGDDMSPEEFMSAVRHFMGYVTEITAAQSGDGADVGWTVRVREGSYLIGVEPGRDAPSSRLSMIYHKAEHAAVALAAGDISSAELSDRAIGHLKALSDLSSKSQNGKGIRLWVQKRPIAISPGIAKTVREDWEADYNDYGSLEGRLEAIRDASGSVKIAVKDFLFPRSIVCSVPERLLETALGSFRKRVEIEGTIHYRRDGTPVSIEAHSIEILPEDDELPSADDVRGIMAVV
ncbi:MAG: hypothetical protein B7Z02_04365 [Rhodobacterales bacterium 32-67-9]|nr:MAG: hypothetical protein B7Z02_04365 [Rhodobacterales bacterium 32-67-9]